jgi:hypothetical protein
MERLLGPNVLEDLDGDGGVKEDVRALRVGCGCGVAAMGATDITGTAGGAERWKGLGLGFMGKSLSSSMEKTLCAGEAIT